MVFTAAKGRRNALDIFNEQEQERYAMERSGKQQLSTEGAGAHADNVAE